MDSYDLKFFVIIGGAICFIYAMAYLLYKNRNSPIIQRLLEPLFVEDPQNDFQTESRYIDSANTQYSISTVNPVSVHVKKHTKNESLYATCTHEIRSGEHYTEFSFGNDTPPIRMCTHCCPIMCPIEPSMECPVRTQRKGKKKL